MTRVATNPGPTNTAPLLPRRSLAFAALLFVLTLALYWRTESFGFLNYDDDVYVTENPGVRSGLTLEGVRWAFTTGHAANWHPLTWLSHQLDVTCFGLAPAWHHRTNALLHALAAALCCLALAALTRAPGKSALAAAFFALHPLRVESVAWIAERKDLLAGALAFASLLAYASHARRGGAGRYALTLALFALGLMAKPMLVTLPALFLMLDVWPLASHAPRARRALEKLPFFALAAASSVATLLVQRAGGAFATLAHVPFGARLANAIGSVGIYLAKTLVPTGLAPFHPHPAARVPPEPAWSAGVLLALGTLSGLAFVAWRARRRAPAVPVGGLWFLGMLVPVLGLVQVGLAGWAERYTYLPSVGLALAVVWGVDAALGASHLGATARRVALGLAFLALGACALASWHETSVWRDSRTLFEHAVASDESAVARNNLGRACEADRDLAGAEKHYARALELEPSLAGARVNLARVFTDQGRVDEAAEQFERALASEPELLEAHANLGWLRAQQGRDAEALPHLRRAHELAPDDLALANNLAWVLATSRTQADAEEARRLAESLIAVSKGAQAAYFDTLAAALARLGRFDDAVAWQTRVVERVHGPERAPLEERLALYRAKRPYLKSP